MVLALVSDVKVRYGWKVVKPHQGSLSGEAWFGEGLTDAGAPWKKGEQDEGGSWVRSRAFQPLQARAFFWGN